MAYQITVENPAETTLTPVLPKLGAARWVLGGLGLLLLAVGLLPLWLRAERGADTLNLAAFVFAAFGLGCLLLGILLRATAGDGPAAFVFDRRRAGVWLRGQASDNAAAAAVLTPSAADVFLPFADIAELLVVTHAHTSSSSSSGSGRTTYSYHVALHLHDGGAWELTSDADRADADAVLARLQALVAAAALVPPAASPAPALPATVAWSQHGGASQLRWRNPVRPAEVLRGLVGMGAFAGVLALFWTLIRAGGNDLPVFVYGVVAFIGGGVGLAAVAQGRRWWRDGHCRYGLDFGPDTVDYVEEASATGRETLRHAVPRAEWYGLSTSFGGNAPDHDPTVLLLTRAAHAQLLHERALRLSLSIGELLTAALTASLARPLRVKQLRPTQRLALVLWARAEAARTHTGS